MSPLRNLHSQRASIAQAAMLLAAALLPFSGSDALAFTTGASNDSDLVEVWNCRFDDEWDVNYDEWPDRWSRTHDSERPKYVRMGVEPISGGSAGRRLVIYPEGASARATSPKIYVMPKFSYKLRLRMKSEQAEHGKVVIRIEFLTAEGEVLQQRFAEPQLVEGVWREIELGDYQPRDRDVDHMLIHFDFERGARSDLNAAISIADLRLYRLPSIRIHTDSYYNVYTNPKDVKVTCTLSGILQQNPEIRFQLLDATNKSIGEGGVLMLDGKLIALSSTRASDIVDGFGSDKDSYEGTIDWHPPVEKYGFYRVRVGMFNPDTGQPVGDPRAITVTVVPENIENTEQTEEGEFGWSLPKADDPLPFDMLLELLPLAGVNQVKTPVWYPVDKPERGEELVRFAEQLGARNIETIGVLEDPTLWIDDPLSEAEAPPIEGLFSTDSSYWLPRIDHVITKLSMRIHWWQLGNDRDTSFVGFNKLIEHLHQVSKKLFRFGQDVRLGIGWRWDHLEDWGKRLSWDFEQMSSVDAIDSAALDTYLSSAPTTTAKRWVLVEPLDNENDPGNEVERHQNRVRDFVEQIIVAKVHGVDGIFVANPFYGSLDPNSSRTGVMNVDGTPGELLLPWRTCARLLSGAEYLGSIHLPNESENWIFKRTDDRIVMVLWNLDSPAQRLDEAPIEERLYLGDKVQLIDVWGKTSPPEEVDGKQVIHIGRMPRFVLGLNEWVARWRMGAKFESTNLPSIFGVTHEDAVLIRNEFPQGVGGKMRVFVPEKRQIGLTDNPRSSDEWQLTPEEHRLSLSAGERFREPMNIVLRDADYGDQPIRLDFDLIADREYKFSVWRDMHVGLGELTLNVQTHLGEDGRLVVEQRMTDSTNSSSDFKCILYAPGRRRKRSLVFHLGSDVDKKRYYYVDGEELIGRELKLRLEQVNGSRVLIHRFVAEDSPLLEDDDADSLSNENW